jgi:hypothetical protein
MIVIKSLSPGREQFCKSLIVKHSAAVNCTDQAGGTEFPVVLRKSKCGSTAAKGKFDAAKLQ